MKKVAEQSVMGVPCRTLVTVKELSSKEQVSRPVCLFYICFPVFVARFLFVVSCCPCFSLFFCFLFLVFLLSCFLLAVSLPCFSGTAPLLTRHSSPASPHSLLLPELSPLSSCCGSASTTSSATTSSRCRCWRAPPCSRRSSRSPSTPCEAAAITASPPPTRESRTRTLSLLKLVLSFVRLHVAGSSRLPLLAPACCVLAVVSSFDLPCCAAFYQAFFLVSCLVLVFPFFSLALGATRGVSCCLPWPLPPLIPSRVCACTETRLQTTTMITPTNTTKQGSAAAAVVFRFPWFRTTTTTVR